jgi:hypothetical protein
MHYCNDCFAVFDTVGLICKFCKSADLVEVEGDKELEPRAGLSKSGETYWELKNDEQ